MSPRADPNPFGPRSGQPTGAQFEQMRPFVVRSRRPRREWYRDTEPSEFDRYVLHRIILPRRDEDTRLPQPPWKYFADEVAEARGITSLWMPLLLHGMDYDEVIDWRECLDPLSIRSFIADYAAATQDAIELHGAGMTPHDLRWRPEDQGWGTLPDRLRRRQLTLPEVITEVKYRRADDAGC